MTGSLSKKAVTTSTFARKLGFKSAHAKGFWKGLNYLCRIGAIEIQQSGFKGDSMHHPKLVVVRDSERVSSLFRVKLSLNKVQEFEYPTFKEEKCAEEKLNKSKIFDFCGYLEAVLDYIPVNIVTEQSVSHLHSWLETEYFQNPEIIESDENFVYGRNLAKRFLLEISHEGMKKAVMLE